MRAMLIRVAQACLIAGVLSGCGGGSGTSSSGALLDLNNLSGGNTSNVTSALVTLDGPTCVQTDQTSDAFTATVKTRSGAVVPDRFVAIEPTFNAQAAGSVQATGPDGRVRLGGANTNSAGQVVFRYLPPTDINTAIIVTLTANVKDGSTTIGTSDISISVSPPGKPRVTVVGPQDPATGQRVASGTLNVKAGQIASGFLVTVRAPSACNGNQLEPVRAATIKVAPTNVNAGIQQEAMETGLDGTALFNYVAPDTVSSKGKDTLTVTASNAGGSAQATYVLNLIPGSTSSGLKLALTGPTSITAGRDTSGYVGTLQEVQTDSDGLQTVTARPGVRLRFSASDGGTVTAVDGGNGIAVTTDDGTAKASFRSRASGTTAQEIQLTAAVDTSTSADIAAACQRVGSVCSSSLTVRVQPDTFVFSSPAYGATRLVGANNAQPLSFSWLSSANTGVNGCVDLQATFQGGSTSPFGVIIGGDPATANAQIKRVQITNGNFANQVSLFSDRSGFVELTAVENRNCGDSPAGSLSATTGVQFVDEICQTTTDGRNCVDLLAPLQVKSSPDASGNQRTVDLRFEVRNNAYQPVDGAQATFAVTADAGRNDPNERVFPGGGTTDANGVANSRYFVPALAPVTTDVNGDGVVDQNDTRTELVDVQACVRRMGTDSSQAATICSTRRIQIVVTGPSP